MMACSRKRSPLVWGIAFAIVDWVLSRSEQLLLRAHVRALAALVALVPAALYAALAGLSVPAARSVAMTAIFVASLGAAREIQPLRVLCLTAATLAIEWPGAPLDISFQLSFTSVLSLVLAAQSCPSGGGRPCRPTPERGYAVVFASRCWFQARRSSARLHWSRSTSIERRRSAC